MYSHQARHTSDKGRHHNVLFAQLSAEMGLYLLNDTADRGAADLTVHAQAWYADEITQLEAALETISA